MNDTNDTPIATAILDTLMSPNETDANLEAANVVDGLFAISRALRHVARAIETLALVNAGVALPEDGIVAPTLTRLTEANR